MNYRLELELIGLPKRINQAPGASWHSRHNESRKWHQRVLGSMIVKRLTVPPMPLDRAKVTFIRHSSRCPDYDGLVHSFKPVMDALKKSLIIKDDSMAHVGIPEYKWVLAKKKEGKITVIVEEIQNEQVA